MRITGGRPSIFMRRQRAVPLPQHRGAASMRPDPGIVREFVWQPIRELAAPVFAFGKPWFGLLEDGFGLQVVDRLGVGGRPYPTEVPSRAVLVLRGENGVIVVAERHSGEPGRRVALKRRSYVRRSNHGSANSEPWCLDLVMCLPAAGGHSAGSFHKAVLGPMERTGWTPHPT